MQKQVAVVIPYYHSQLSETEQISFDQCLKIFDNYPIFLVVPDTIREEECLVNDKILLKFVSSQWMQSVSAYNRMMLTVDFYSLFLEYKYILIYQLDAFVFYDGLLHFCYMDYDYIGAPWPFGARYKNGKDNHKQFVGNGGFSLRKVTACIEILKTGMADLWDLQEDIFWSVCDSEKFRVAPKEIALTFSIEEPAEKLFNLNQKRIPFGCHAWIKWSFHFWKPFIENEGYNFSDKFVSENRKRFERTAGKLCSLSCEIINQGMKEILKQKEKQICIWGAGVIGREWIVELRCAGWNVTCVDSNKEIWGEYFWDVCIESPELLKTRSLEVPILIAVKKHKDQVMSQLMKMGCRAKVYDYLSVLELLVKKET